MTQPLPPVRPSPDGVLIDVWVVPGSHRPGFDGLHDGAVRLRVAAPPEGGRANLETGKALADATGGRRGRVVSGGGARRKVVEVEGTDVGTASQGLRGRGVPL
ncbi:MAG: DUF167 domain-containing protein [Acidimicrobiia bacterium]|nr:DUF167 domain-containing protein [Acidimicrobiia bacterium]